LFFGKDQGYSAAVSDGVARWVTALDQFGNFRIPLVYEYFMPHLNPFRTQFGYAAVTKNSKVPNSWGMVDARGRGILPEKFQYVRAITHKMDPRAAKRTSGSGEIYAAGGFSVGMRGGEVFSP
jgi:hypothetical protein